MPKHLHEWVGAPASGAKRTVSFEFAGQVAPVTLRRLANAYGHVQFRYEGGAGAPLREWLAATFQATCQEACGEYLEIIRLADDRFRVVPNPLGPPDATTLQVREWVTHRCSGDLLTRFPLLSEIPAILRRVEYRESEGQKYYNACISDAFREWEWKAERLVVPELPLKSDFMKDGVQVEVEFGNARTYYQDYVKFLLAHNRGLARIGVLVVPTEAFARSLCRVGLQSARERGGRSYSGMIHIGKVRREMEHLEFMLGMPIAVAGIGSRSAERLE